MPQIEPPAIFFHPDAIETAGKDLVGRRSAGHSFLRGFLQHMPGEHVNAVVEGPNVAKAFEKVAREMGENRQIRVDFLKGRSDFTRAGTVFFPSPGYMNAPWRRQRFGATKCSLVGVTHTVSTRRVIEGLHNLTHQPVEPWDALICTSRAVQSVVARQLELEAEFTRARYGATRVPQPQLPIIPLGICCEDFTASPAYRAEARKRHNTPDDAIVVLTMGRWAVSEKANPVPMFLALEYLATQSKRPIHLWMAGWTSHREEEALHRDGAARMCPNVTTHLIDGRDAWVRRAIWSGADIFTLPVDNIQETFGLVPLEAMAAGLPVVMPDWDGFRDTIVDGTTGFLVPTRMARPGSGDALAERFADGTDDYVRHLALVAQQTQIDVPAYALALGRLAEDADLRAKMGAAGVAHVRANYDLSAVIPQYRSLAEKLREDRLAAVPSTARLSNTAVSPVEVDPFDLYRHYPSQILCGSTSVTWRRPLTANDLVSLDQINGRTLNGRKMVGDSALVRLAALVAELRTTTLDNLGAASGMTGPSLEAAVLFLAKYDIVGLTTSTETGKDLARYDVNSALTKKRNDGPNSRSKR